MAGVTDFAKTERGTGAEKDVEEADFSAAGDDCEGVFFAGFGGQVHSSTSPLAEANKKS